MRHRDRASADVLSLCAVGVWMLARHGMLVNVAGGAARRIAIPRRFLRASQM